MTGFKSKKTAALDEDGMYLVHQTEQKPVQKIWDTPSEKFNNWWNAEYDDSANPFEVDTFAYWAWAGWQAALAQPAQKLTLQEQLVKARADWDKAQVDWRKADTDMDKAYAYRRKAKAALERIEKLMEQQND